MSARRQAFALAGIWLVVALPATLWAQVPVGSEFQVNTYTYLSQVASSVAYDGNGGFLVVWDSQSKSQGPQDWIFGQRYDASGAAVGGEFQINRYTGNQSSASAAFDHASGHFVVAWHGPHAGGSGNDVLARVFDPGGKALGPEFIVNTYTSLHQVSPSVASLAGGDFVVAWRSSGQDGDGYSIQGQRLDAMGGLLGNEFQINAYTTHNQMDPQVASQPSGDFVVVWTGRDGYNSGVIGRRFDSSGTAIGDEFQVNIVTLREQERPSVAVAANGGFVVTWQRFPRENVFARGFDASGKPIGPEFQVSANTAFAPKWAGVAPVSGGGFVVVWTTGAGLYSVSGRSVDPSGAPMGAEFKVNSYTGFASAFLPRIASDGDDNFTVVWTELLGQDGSFDGVFGQRFNTPLAVGIDIGPGRFPNRINPNRKGLLPVAILTTPIFDATTVDALSVRFGPDGAADSDAMGQIQDVDGDGDDDFLLHFRMQETGIQCGQPFASLTGRTNTGQALQGSDGIVTIECP